MWRRRVSDGNERTRLAFYAHFASGAALFLRISTAAGAKRALVTRAPTGFIKFGSKPAIVARSRVFMTKHCLRVRLPSDKSEREIRTRALNFYLSVHCVKKMLSSRYERCRRACGNLTQEINLIWWLREKQFLGFLNRWQFIGLEEREGVFF